MTPAMQVKLTNSDTIAAQMAETAAVRAKSAFSANCSGRAAPARIIITKVGGIGGFRIAGQ
ncbi:hypothetical protein GCM10010991_24990 [Gemmobacter aquaticus]|uniref:Uncharacterized protein n=1 Tax=Gemmobacter aquaticus TaxID=490185 RepID=A0A917YKK5_9RHOB|nr:hypothetical protein GCM10010991_24990 [Gemmobacter aquaticus]